MKYLSLPVIHVFLEMPKAEVDNTLRDLQNSSYPTKAEFNNCFIIHSKYFPVLNGVSPFRSLFFCSPKSQSRPQVFFGQRLNNLPRAPLLTSFWRQRLNNMQRAPLLTSLIEYDEDSFQIWWTAAGYGELCVWLQPIRNGEIFWMNNNCLSFRRFNYHIISFR